MITFGPLIIEKGLKLDRMPKTRYTARAIIVNKKNEYLMAYSSMFDDYTFAGGGLKSNENFEMALKRELLEELGAVISIDKPLGFTEELRYGIRGEDDIYLQTSFYYLCHVDHYKKASLKDREVAHGLVAKWVEIDDALKQNEKIIVDKRHQTKGLKTVLIRENMVLKKLKELDLCADLKL